MKHQALVSHSPAFGRVLAEFRRAQRLLHRHAKGSMTKQEEILRRSVELNGLREQLFELQWHSPVWTDIEAAIPTEQSSEDRLKVLDEIRTSLAQHIDEVCAEPSVCDQIHVDIDKIDIYLDGLLSLVVSVVPRLQHCD